VARRLPRARAHAAAPSAKGGRGCGTPRAGGVEQRARGRLRPEGGVGGPIWRPRGGMVAQTGSNHDRVMWGKNMCSSHRTYSFAILTQAPLCTHEHGLSLKGPI